MHQVFPLLLCHLIKNSSDTFDYFTFEDAGIQRTPCILYTAKHEKFSRHTQTYFSYRLKGEPRYDTVTEINEDYVSVRGLQPDKVYEFIVGSVDGNYTSESDMKEVETYASGKNLFARMFLYNGSVELSNIFHNFFSR